MNHLGSLHHASRFVSLQVANEVPSDLFGQSNAVVQLSLPLDILIQLTSHSNELLHSAFAKIGMPQPEQRSNLLEGGGLGHRHEENTIRVSSGPEGRFVNTTLDVFVPCCQTCLFIAHDGEMPSVREHTFPRPCAQARMTIQQLSALLGGVNSRALWRRPVMGHTCRWDC